jgi:hypothetical protein
MSDATSRAMKDCRTGVALLEVLVRLCSHLAVRREPDLGFMRLDSRMLASSTEENNSSIYTASR